MREVASARSLCAVLCSHPRVVYSEVITNEAVDNRGGMGDSGSTLYLYATEFEFGKMLNESIVSELASFGDTEHMFANDEKVSVVDEGLSWYYYFMMQAGMILTRIRSQVLVLVHEYSDRCP
jgi:hypothetical protein